MCVLIGGLSFVLCLVLCIVQGKYVQVLFDRQCHIIGASISSYLLEKSRVVLQAQGERNYRTASAYLPVCVSACLPVC
jgi:hypothetical protein